MPIPFLLGAAALVTTGFGVKKAVDAHSDNEAAKRINREANEIIDDAKRAIEVAKKNANDALCALGTGKIAAYRDVVTPFLDSYGKIKHIELLQSQGLDELANFKIDKNAIANFKEGCSIALECASGAASGLGAGALTAFGAYGATMAFASASTGTAITALSGAAATNATLAFLGGGSLAAGGLGMAGGMTVLGGLVAAPALAIMGCVMGAKAEKNKEEARSNLAIAKQFKEEMKNACVLCDAIKQRSDNFTYTLKSLCRLASRSVEVIQGIIMVSGTDFRDFNDGQRKSLAMSLSLMQAIKAILDTPILTQDGKLTDDSEKILDTVEKQMALLVN